MIKKILLSLLCFISVYSVHAKRTPPPIINSIEINGYKYCANFDSNLLSGNGVIEVYNIKSQEKEKVIIIYSVLYNIFLEKDVQWIFIKQMERINNNIIRITNENEQVYDLDLKTMKVVKVKK